MIRYVCNDGPDSINFLMQKSIFILHNIVTVIFVLTFLRAVKVHNCFDSDSCSSVHTQTLYILFLLQPV